VDEPTDDLGWALGSLLRSYRDRVAPLLEDVPHGARGYQTLQEVVKEERPSQVALASHLGIDRTVMTYLVDDLVEAGLVERRQNPADRRQRQVVATARGRRLLARTCDRVAEAERQVLGGLDDWEREVLRGLLTKAAGPPSEHDGDPCEVVVEELGTQPKR